VTRNVFALKDPPPPPPPPDNTPPAPKLSLVGIANVLGTRKAVLKTEPRAGRAAQTRLARHRSIGTGATAYSDRR
jgi:hypothetical protein